MAALVKPSCLIIDEVGRCTFDKPCTDLFFDIVDRRYEKEGPNTMILTSNTSTNNWDEFFTGDDTLLCTLDRLFDRDEGRELPRGGAGDILGGVFAYGNQDEQVSVGGLEV